MAVPVREDDEEADEEREVLREALADGGRELGGARPGGHRQLDREEGQGDGDDRVGEEGEALRRITRAIVRRRVPGPSPAHGRHPSEDGSGDDSTFGGTRP